MPKYLMCRVEDPADRLFSPVAVLVPDGPMLDGLSSTLGDFAIFRRLRPDLDSARFPATGPLVFERNGPLPTRIEDFDEYGWAVVDTRKFFFQARDAIGVRNGRIVVDADPVARGRPAVSGQFQMGVYEEDGEGRTLCTPSFDAVDVAAWRKAFKLDRPDEAPCPT